MNILQAISLINVICLALNLLLFGATNVYAWGVAIFLQVLVGIFYLLFKDFQE